MFLKAIVCFGKEDDELAVCPLTCSLAEKRLECLRSEAPRDSHSSSCLQQIERVWSSSRDPPSVMSLEGESSSSSS